MLCQAGSLEEYLDPLQSVVLSCFCSAAVTCNPGEDGHDQPPPADMDNMATLAQSAPNDHDAQTAPVGSYSTKHMPCRCTRADPDILRAHCSVKGRGWPQNNAEWVTDCFDLLANRQSGYLHVSEHNPSGVDCSRQLIMHTFWAGDMTQKLKAVIQSFLFSHYTSDTSCRPKPVLNIWLQSTKPTRCVV